MAGRPVLISWGHQPMVRFLLPFCLGILMPLWLNAIILLCMLWLTWLSLQVYFLKKSLNKRNILAKCCLFFFVVACGMLVAASVGIQPASGLKSGYGLLEVLPEPVYKRGKFHFDASVQAVYHQGSWLRTHENIRVNLTADSNYLLRTGDIIFGKIKPISPPDARSPGTFSMKDWLAGKHIRYMINLDSTEWIATGLHGQLIQRTLIDLRKKMIARLADAGLGKRELAVAGALILGDRSEIDKELVNDFTASGLVHILAVSGMHVGLIYGAWLLIFGLILPRKVSYLGILSAIPLIWSYAILTGLSASVIRATVMYTILAIASLRKIPTIPFNALAAAAFLMLLQDPGVYQQAGFQLSFAAVWGIIAAQPLIRKCEGISFRLFRMIAISGMVTLAAQLATAPLGFYHFGAFPVYFFIANLLAVPLSTILTYWGIISTLFAPVPALGTFFVRLLGWGIDLLNSLAHGVQSLPYSRISGYYISFWEFLVALMILLQLSWLLVNPARKRLKLVLTLVLCLSILSCFIELPRRSGSYYLAVRKGKQLDLVIQSKGKCSHICLGKNIPKLDDRDILLALGKKFRLDHCKAHYLISRSDIEFKPGKNLLAASWKELPSLR